MRNLIRALRLHLGSLLLQGAQRLLPPPVAAAASPGPATPDRSPLAAAASPPGASVKGGPPPGSLAGGSDPALTAAQREPISVERAVLQHDMRVLRREAADALAALGAAHALVSSSRLAQVQDLRQQLSQGRGSDETLLALAADYQAWINDQVRLFDALALVMRLQVPSGAVLEQVDPALESQARHHLTSLSLEYERQQLVLRHEPAAGGDG
ncbi:MAG: hypothetical protein VKK62_03055 [Synechococcaceae cyanobacterium]|nr:hypothetical protein [Synechococcaceae cyanobacterium]